MADIDKQKLFEAIEGSSGGKIDKEKLKQAVKSGDATSLLGYLSESDRQKINRALADKSNLEKILNSKEAKQLLNSLIKGGKNNG